MVTFDHRDRSRPAASWHELVADVPTLDLASVARLVVLAAHPDDETLGAGGVIATAATLELDIEVVIATNGERSHPDSSTHSPARLSAIRRREASQAVAALAPTAKVSFLDLPDGELSDHVDEIAQLLKGVCNSFGWLLSPWLGDRHPDHAACARAARLAATPMRHWEYPIWLWHWGNPDDALPAGMRRVILSEPARAARDRALRAYPSQSAPLSDEAGDEAVLAPDFLAHFNRSYDVLIEPEQAAVTSPDYFPQLYAAADDPWQLADRWYERRKRALIMASLPRESFRRAFEPGCATGQLSIELSRRCDSVIAGDIADRAVAQARIATEKYTNVSVSRMSIPGQWPPGRFDLIVLSEIGYYLDLDELATRISQSLTEDGVLVSCHWRHRADDHAHSAEHTHAVLRSATGLHLLASHVEDDFLLDVLTRSSVSVARAEAIVS